ncbi:MAG: argininosuccinate synthase [Acidiferrobacteraceae bacterium]|nr:argininosuccinate synthase [Acidiferrobacteraceae bacterium]|tara:strand:- start:1510 stop:2718 length:1209 start_codon:yes stop_codon:yes gene_type:complete
MNKIKRVVLAYSGGLDTSVILKWLQQQYQCEVVTFTADLGQGEELDAAREKAIDMGAESVFIEDLREEFARDYIFPIFRANALYEGEYLLGTSIARPLIARHLVRIAAKTHADAIAHGATGKGNDQVRFEIGAYALDPEIQIIAPWREWALNSREKLVDFAKTNNIAVDTRPDGSSTYSTDANLLHISYEGGELEDPRVPPSDDMWRWTVSPQAAPAKAESVNLTFQHGDPIAVNGVEYPAGEIMEVLNRLGSKHGIGRADIVENRYVGMKSRGCYETPGGTILIRAHRAIESITLDREVAHLKDELMPRYASLVYNGYWWAPERLMMQEMIDKSQLTVNGSVDLDLYKGNVIVRGRSSENNSLYDEGVVTFEDDGGTYSQSDAEGFIRLNALRLRIAARQK